MALTLGLTGMDPATEVALKAAVAEANARLGGDWSLLPEAEADHVVVDMDSMYGPMSWLRLHAAGKSVIGLTTAERTQADLHLARPFNPDSVAEVLEQAASADGRKPAGKAGARAQPSAASAKAPARQPKAEAPPPWAELEATVPEAASAPPAPVQPDTVEPEFTFPAAPADTEKQAEPIQVRETAVADSVATPSKRPREASEETPFAETLFAAKTPAAQSPELPAAEFTQPIQAQTRPPVPSPPPPPPPVVPPAAVQAPPPVVPPAAVQAPPPYAAPKTDRGPTVTDPAIPSLRQRTLPGWLEPGALKGRVRYQSPQGETLLIDADRRQYHGPATLKPLTGYFQGTLGRDEFVPLDDPRWATESKAMGAAQPLTRLQWYGGLLAGQGKLLPGFDPNGRYKLTKWPETEREFPHHFRLATMMMKGPATLEEIATASSVAIDKVADYVNASLASGFAEYVTSSEPTGQNKPSSLFERLRGK